MAVCLTSLGNNIQSPHLRLFSNVRSWQCGPPETHCDWPYMLSLPTWTPFLGYIPRFVVYEKYKDHSPRRGKYAPCPQTTPLPSIHFCLRQTLQTLLTWERKPPDQCALVILHGGHLFILPTLFPTPTLSWLNSQPGLHCITKKLKKDGIDAWARGTLLVAVVTTNERFPKRRGMVRSHDPSQCPVTPGGLGFGLRKGAGGVCSSYVN